MCFCSGLAGLTYEVIWQRVLVLVVGNSAAATTAVLAAVMLGLGLGSLLAARYADRGDPLVMYGVIEVALGVLAAVVPQVARLAGDFTSGWALGDGPAPFAVRFAVAAAVVLAPATLMGATVPILARFAALGSRGIDDPVGPSAGLVYGLNTAGAALGCMLTGYVLLGRVGVFRTGAAAAAIDVAVGAIAIWIGIRGGNPFLCFARARVDRSRGTSCVSRIMKPFTPREVQKVPPGPPSPKTFRHEKRGVLHPYLVLLLAAVSGASVLALEGLWTRMLRIVFGHDVHAFSSMLASVLVGLALGSGIYAVLPGRARQSKLLLPGLFAALGLSEVLSLAVVGALYLHRGLDIFAVGPSLGITQSHEQGLVLQALFTAVLVLAPATAAGAILPALCAAFQKRVSGGNPFLEKGVSPGPPSPKTSRDIRIEARRAERAIKSVDPSSTGARVGLVLAANTAGAIVGAVLPQAVLVPYLGIQRSFVSVAAVAIGAAALCLASVRELRTTIRALGCTLLVLSLGLSAIAVPAGLPRQALARKVGPSHQRFLFYREGATGTVAVVEDEISRERQVYINGVNEVTTRLVHDQSFKLLGHLGLLVHPHPRDVLVICLGAGLSAGAAATHDVESIRVVDLERSVVGAARMFGELNNGLLDDRRVAVSFEDGRHHLRATEARYDVIVVDSTHPRAVDSWLLYTRELYALARSRLRSEGYFVQWVPLHGLSVDELRIIVHTFLSEFPQGSLWVNAGYERYGPAGYALLLGSTGDGTIDRRVVERRLAAPAVRADLVPWGLQTLPEVLECFVAGPDALRRWTGFLPINTDDLPLTQFVTSYSRAAPMSLERLLEVREPVAPVLEPALGAADSDLAADLRRRYLAQGFLFAGQLERAVEACGPGCEKPPMFALTASQGPPYFAALRRRYEGDPERLLEIARSLSSLGRNDEAVATLERAVDLHRADARLWLELGLAHSESGNVVAARRAFRASLAHDPGLASASVGLGLLEVHAGRSAEGLEELERALERDPSLPDTHAALGFAYFVADDPRRAERHLWQALVLDPRNRDARIGLGRLRLAQGRDPEAVDVFRTARRLFPYDGDVAYNLGLALLRTEQPAQAVRAIEAAVRIDPTDQEAADLLRAARTAVSLTPR
jgi:spermidine synthase/tetratricopeptide (TPR) repeat protein